VTASGWWAGFSTGLMVGVPVAVFVTAWLLRR
jgi:hypothetical protein